MLQRWVNVSRNAYVLNKSRLFFHQAPLASSSHLRNVARGSFLEKLEVHVWASVQPFYWRDKLQLCLMMLITNILIGHVTLLMRTLRNVQFLIFCALTTMLWMWTLRGAFLGLQNVLLFTLSKSELSTFHGTIETHIQSYNNCHMCLILRWLVIRPICVFKFESSVSTKRFRRKSPSRPREDGENKTNAPVIINRNLHNNNNTYRLKELKWFQRSRLGSRR